MNKRLWIVGGVFVAAFAVVLLSYFKPWERPEVKTRTVRLNAPVTAVDFAPYYVAKKKAWFEEALSGIGAKPDYLPPLQTFPAINEALAADRVDMLMAAETVAIFGKSRGTDVKILWLSCTLESEVIVPIASTVTSITDLKGKKIGTLNGSGPHFWFIKNLESKGLRKNDVTFLNLSPPDGKVAFETGQIDAWAIFPPFPEQELLEGKAKVLPGLKAPVQVVLVARGAFCEEQPDLAAGVVAALDRAKKWIIENPAEAQAIVAEEINLPLAVVKAAWPKMVWNAQLDDAVVADIQEQADFFLKEDIIRNPVNVRKDLILKLRK